MPGKTNQRKFSTETAGFSAGGQQRSLPSWPLLATDFLIVFLIAGFPFIMGGREAWGHRILISSACALGCTWCFHLSQTGGRYRFMTLEPLLFAGLALVWLQSSPLSPRILDQLSPEYQRLIPAWSSTQLSADGTPSASEWSTASLYPSETRHAFLMLMAYGLIGMVLSQRIASEADCGRLLKLIGLSGTLMAAFAVLQLATSNDRFFWFYQHPYTGTREVLKGAFTNRNHFAQFLALSVGPLIWWMLVGRVVHKTSTVMERKGLGPAQGNHSRIDDLIDVKLLLLICATGGVLLAVMLSLSRGGMIAAAAACCVCLAGLWRSGKVRSSLAAVMVALGVMAIGGMVVFGQDQVENRVAQIASGDADKIDQLNARRTIWKADFKAIQAFPILGTGVGSHRFIYPIYMEELGDFSGTTFSHAESSYIHLALETGLTGLGLLVLGVLFVLGRIGLNFLKRTEPERLAGLAAVVAGLTGGVLHAVADFIWYVPAIVVTTIAMIVIGLRFCSGFHPNAGLPVPRVAWLTGAIACLAALVVTQKGLAARVNGERYFFQYLITAKELQKTLAESAAGNDASLPDLSQNQAVPEFQSPGTEVAKYEPEPVPEKGGPIETSLRRQITLLRASLKANPQQADVSARLAKKCLDLFDVLQMTGQMENSLPLPHIRDAVVASRFETVDAMNDFLRKAFGSPMKLIAMADQASRQSLALCPVQDEPYKYLVSAGFLRDPQDRLSEKMMAQALRLGRNSPSTRFAIGESLLLAGRMPEALKHWNAVFHSTPEIRRDICRRLGRKFAVDVVLLQFDPTVDELLDVLNVYRTYQRKKDLENLLFVVEQKTQFLDKPEEATGNERHLTLLMTANRVAEELKDHTMSETLLRRAVQADPAAEPPHRALGLLLLQMERYQEAEKEFAWCYDQLPGDSKLEELRRECRRLQSRQERLIRPASHQTPSKTARRSLYSE